MRGTLFSLVVECQLKGLIPTYAGNTSCGDEVSVFDGAHPHVCGEHFWTVKESSSTLGSSPRMRGTLRFRVDRFTVDGLIPTYAGNTRLRRRRAGRRRAHPHVCGEHFCAPSTGWADPGSSPRMRGTPNLPSGVTESQGLIPTYAGNTCRGRGDGLLPGAHPHVCGEHTVTAGMLAEHKGSSPRMRGTLLREAEKGSSRGLIPTYAGNTPQVVCLVGGVVGSSPRMRGTPGCGAVPAESVGLIPTYAGNTGWYAVVPGLVGAHPHVCGEHLVR